MSQRRSRPRRKTAANSNHSGADPTVGALLPPYRWIAEQLDVGSDAEAVRRGLQVFRTLLFAHAFVRICSWAPASPLPTASYTFVAAFAVLFAVALTRHARWACIGAAGLMALEQISAFPATANHVYLEYLCFVLFALLDPENSGERDLLITAFRWVALVVLFFTGLQKVLLDHYFGGEFLLFAIGARSTFAEFFALLLPATEVDRLAAEQMLEAGAGPFRTEAPLFLFATNLVWVAEILLPIGMLIRRTRTASTLIAIAMVLSLQLAAREMMFALLFTQTLLLVPPETWNRRAMWVYVVGYTYLFAYVIGLVPERYIFGGGVW